MKGYLLSFVALLLITISAIAQTSKISGKVVDNNGSPVAGASVVIEGTKSGASTGEDGTFSIPVKEGTGTITLSISSKGFKATSVKTKAGAPVSVSLEKEASNMDEVVVVGYQTVKRRDLTTSVSSVSAKQLKDVPVASAAEAITGRLAGVNVTTTEGQPGANIIIRVRGGGSLTQDNSPLYVVDGIQVENALSILAPSEIQSIDVLKDASSTAIYGARGANGVVLITTKSGSKGMTQPVVAVDAYWGVRKIAKELKVLNPYDFVNFERDVYALKNDTSTFIKKYGQYADMDIYKNMPNENWQDDVFGRNALEQNYSVGLTGGNKSTTYAASLAYNNADGIQIGTGFQRYLASLKLDQTISNKFKAGFSIRYSSQRVDGQGTSDGKSSSTANRLRNVIRYKPYKTPGDSDQSFATDDDSYDNTSSLLNPILVTRDAVRHTYTNNLILNGYVSWNILKDLVFKTSAGVVNTTTRTNSFYGMNTYETNMKNNGQPSATMASSLPVSLTWTNTLSYNKTIAKKHSLNLLAGQEVYQINTKSTSISNSFLPKDITADQAFARIQTFDPGVATPSYTVSSSDAPSEKLASFFAKANYSYDGKYIATASYRIDGSSKFASGNRWGKFPAASVAWRISQEDFMKNVKALSDLKLRFSYGAAGNNRISADVFWMNFANSVNYGYAFNNNAVALGIVSANLANSGLKWETTITRDLGVDFGFFNNRITGSFDAYLNNVKNLLIQAPVPATSGYVTQYQNIGRTENRGLELQLAAQVIAKKDFQWTSTLNISTNKNKIVDLGTTLGTNSPILTIPSASGWSNTTISDFLTAVGHPVGDFYGYVADGFYKPEDFTGYDATSKKFILKDGVVDDATALGITAVAPGTPKLKKLANDKSNIINENDKTVLGNARPKFYGGWNNQFAYKNFDMSVFMNFSVGNKIYNANKIEYSSCYYSDNNMLAIFKDRFRPYDDNGQLVTDLNQLAAMNKNAKIFFPTRSNTYPLTSYAVEDGSFLRISNITIGYTLPANLVKRTKAISKLRVYATVNNILCITGYSGYDPEVSTRNSTPLTPGVDYSAFPRSRFFVGGLNITF